MRLRKNCTVIETQIEINFNISDIGRFLDLKSTQVISKFLLIYPIYHFLQFQLKILLYNICLTLTRMFLIFFIFFFSFKFLTRILLKNLYIYVISEKFNKTSLSVICFLISTFNRHPSFLTFYYFENNFNDIL